MPLTAGTRLGPYQIVDEIGVGGMGEVYRARDTKLGRDVALKILPDAFAADPDRLARFQREAKTLASLNHPNIGGIHGLEESNGVTALVMELVEGEDLAQRIARGAIPLDECLAIARQIADALEAAHEQGIVHRDLKPVNIKVRADGTAKVLDFGLAKAMESAGRSSSSVSMSPTITSPALVTGVGVLLGTAAYMAGPPARLPRWGPRGAGASARQTGRSARRHLGVRLCPLRDAHGPAGIRWRRRSRNNRGDHSQGTVMEFCTSRHAADRARSPSPMSREGSETAAP